MSDAAQQRPAPTASPDIVVTLPATAEELERYISTAERASYVLASAGSRSLSLSLSQQVTQEVPTPTQRDVEEAMRSLRGVVAEVALYNEALRYPWGDLRRAYGILIDAALERYMSAFRAARDDDETKLFVGTISEYAKRLSSRSLADTEDDTAEIVMHPHEIDRARTEIHELLDGFEAAPFTLQRLSELVLEPEQQYTSLDKYLNALTIVLSVSTSSALLGVPRSGAQRTSVSLKAEGS